MTDAYASQTPVYVVVSNNGCMPTVTKMCTKHAHCLYTSMCRLASSQLGCHIHKGTYLMLSLTLTIMLTLLTLTITVTVTINLILD